VVVEPAAVPDVAAPAELGEPQRLLGVRERPEDAHADLVPEHGQRVERVRLFVGGVAAPALEDRPLAWTSVLGFAVAGVTWLAGVYAAGILATSVLFATSRVPLGTYNVGVKSVLQTGVPNDHLGRAMATVGTASAIVTPLGMLAGGALGEVLPARTVLYASGVGLLLAAAYWALVPSLRRFGPPTAVESGAFSVGE